MCCYFEWCLIKHLSVYILILSNNNHVRKGYNLKLYTAAATANRCTRTIKMMEYKTEIFLKNFLRRRLLCLIQLTVAAILCCRVLFLYFSNIVLAIHASMVNALILGELLQRPSEYVQHIWHIFLFQMSCYFRQALTAIHFEWYGHCFSRLLTVI